MLNAVGFSPVVHRAGSSWPLLIVSQRCAIVELPCVTMLPEKNGAIAVHLLARWSPISSAFGSTGEVGYPTPTFRLFQDSWARALAQVVGELCLCHLSMLVRRAQLSDPSCLCPGPEAMVEPATDSDSWDGETATLASVEGYEAAPNNPNLHSAEATSSVAGGHIGSRSNPAMHTCTESNDLHDDSEATCKTGTSRGLSALSP